MPDRPQPIGNPPGQRSRRTPQLKNQTPPTAIRLHGAAQVAPADGFRGEATPITQSADRHPAPPNPRRPRGSRRRPTGKAAPPAIRVQRPSDKRRAPRHENISTTRADERPKCTAPPPQAPRYVGAETQSKSARPADTRGSRMCGRFAACRAGGAVESVVRPATVAPFMFHQRQCSHGDIGASLPSQQSKCEIK